MVSTSSLWGRISFFSLWLFPLFLTSQFMPQPTPAVAEPYDITNLNCRYGVSDTGHNQYFGTLEVGWAVDFVATRTQPYPNGADHVPIIRIKQDLDGEGNRLPSYTIISPPGGLSQLETLLLANPGELWLIGNEVDRLYQDDLMPDMYAKAYHDLYTFIKSVDHTAQVAISGLVRVSPGRLQYLDLVIENYRTLYGTMIPVDVWNMHAYTLPERSFEGEYAAGGIALGTDPAIALYAPFSPDLTLCQLDYVSCYLEMDSIPEFAKQVVDMRQWMKNNGEQNKPLIISEFSILAPYVIDSEDSCFIADENGVCFPPSRVISFMEATFEYLETAADPEIGYPLDNNRLVQSWLWFTSHARHPDLVGSSSILVNIDGQSISEVGQAHAQWIRNQPRNIELLLLSTSAPAVTIAPTQTVTVTLTAEVLNNGNTALGNDVPIIFKNADGQTIGQTILNTPFAGCALKSQTVTFAWPNLAPGVYHYTAHIGQSSSPNQIKSGVVFVNPVAQVYLPILRYR